jgi:hypothetical protein
MLIGKAHFQALWEPVATFMDRQPSREYAAMSAGTAQCSGTWTTPAGTWPVTIFNIGGNEAGTLCQKIG